MGPSARIKQRNDKKNPTEKNFENIFNNEQKKMVFKNRQQYNNILGTARERHVMLVDQSIDALKLLTLLTQVKYNLILSVNVEK